MRGAHNGQHPAARQRDRSCDICNEIGYDIACVAGTKMHQTTVRFGSDLWEALEEEAARLGVSVAHYVRDAALARLAYNAGRRGDPAFEMGLGESVAAPRGEVLPPESAAEHARETALGHMESSAALWAQGRLARARARELAQRASRLRGRQPAPRPGA